MAINWDKIKKEAKQKDARQKADRAKYRPPQPQPKPTPLFKAAQNGTCSPVYKPMLDAFNATPYEKMQNSIKSLAQRDENQMYFAMPPMDKGIEVKNDNTPSFFERIGKTVTGSAKNIVGSTLNVPTTALNAIDGLKSDEFRASESAGIANKRQELEAKINDPNTPALMRVFYRKQLDNLNNSLTLGQLNDTTSNIMNSGATDISRAKQGAGFAGRTLVDVGSGGLQLAGDVGLAALTGGSALAPMALRSFGGSAYEAKQNGGSVGEQLAYGGLSAATSMLVEKFSNVGNALSKAYGKGLLNNSLQKSTSSVINKLIKNGVISDRVATALVAAGGEGLEESIESTLSPIYQRLTYDPDAQANAEDILYDGLVGAIVGGLAGGIGGSNVQSQIIEQSKPKDTIQQPTSDIQNVGANPAQSTQIAQDVAQDSIKAPQEVTEAPTVAQNVQSNINAPIAQEAAQSATEDVKPITEQLKPEIKATDNTSLPQGTGAMKAQFPYVETSTQSKAADSIFTEQEKADNPDLGNPKHKVYSNAESEFDARERLGFDYEAEKTDLENMEWGAAETVMGYQILSDLTEEARRTGNYSEAIKWKKIFDAKGTEEGQALQARKQFVASPEYIITEAAEALENSTTRKLSKSKKAKILKDVTNQAEAYRNISEGDVNSLIELIKRNSEIRRTTGIFAKKTSKQMNWALETYAKEFDGSEQTLRDVAVAQIRNIAGDYSQISPLNAVKSYRIMGMLSRISTVFRNLVGNNVFDPIETLSNDMVVPFDVLLSKMTGTRSISADKSWFSKAKRKGSLEGGLKSFIQVGLDADVTDAQSKYETLSGRTFKMSGNPLERLLSTWSKFENYALQTTDEFQKGGIASESQKGIDTLKSQGKIADDVFSDRAKTIAKERTFQADSKLAQATIGTRNALNKFSLKDKQGGSFGVGDLTIPFAKVPANIVTQGTNYTPLGLVNSIKDLGKVMYQAHKGTLTPELQAKAVTNLGRSINGTAGIAMFTALALKGIIGVAGDDDWDKENLERAEGKNGTQLNISALMRWINGENTEWQKSDTLISIGFLEPVNAQMAAGALIADTYKEDGTLNGEEIAKSSISAVVQSVLDLPAVSQINDLVTGYKYANGDTEAEKMGEAGIKYLGSQASSFFIPNFVKGIATGADDTVRNTYGGNTKENIRDNILSGIPVAREKLPVSLDPFGNKKTYTGNPLLNALNSNILPGKITKYKQSEVGAELERLSEATEKNNIYPNRKPPNSVVYGDNTYYLDAEQKETWQKTVGKLTHDLMQSAINQNVYFELSDEGKSEVLSKAISIANDTAKRKFIGTDYESNWDNENDLPREKLAEYLAYYEMYAPDYRTAQDNKDTFSKSDIAAQIVNSDASQVVKDELYRVTTGNSYYDKWKDSDGSVPSEKYFEVLYFYNTAKTITTDDGKEIKPKQQTLDYISNMNVSDAMKDNLYYVCGYSSKTLYQAPWK